MGMDKEHIVKVLLKIGTLSSEEDFAMAEEFIGMIDPDARLEEMSEKLQIAIFNAILIARRQLDFVTEAVHGHVGQLNYKSNYYKWEAYYKSKGSKLPR